MPPKVAIVVPTRRRPSYLDVALATIAAQAVERSAEVLVIDDGPDPRTRAVAERHGARYVAHERSLGLNAARNTAIAATDAALLAFVDDDVAVRPGWLAALVGAADSLPEEVGVLTGPIAPRVEGRRFRACGREGGPITWLDEGPRDTDCEHAWGANMAIRRSALDRVGPFDATHELYGDEQEWQARWKAAGGRIRYIAAAALDHRRAGDDARLRSLCGAARARGRASRRQDIAKGTAPTVGSELRTLAGCALHGPRYRCLMGPVMTWHTLGRLEEALRPGSPPPATPGLDDFLSGRSGNALGRRAALLDARDRWLDARDVLGGRRRRLRRVAAQTPRRRVLALTIARPEIENRVDALREELGRSRHDVEHVVAPATSAGKFQRLNELLAGRDPQSVDWLLVVDDDVDLPRRFLDAFLAVAERHGLRIAQPAHRRRSHAAWEVTRRVPGCTLRETTFVEIGPVTAFRQDTLATLLPFPDVRMGWGLDAHWSALARERGWPIGVVDATPVGHLLRPAAATYPRDRAIAEARTFLAGRPYVTRDEVRTLAVHR